MPPRDLVSLRSRDLDHLARRYRELAVDFGKSMQGALNEVATSSTKRMRDRFESDIDGGPTKWTAIKPGSTSGSVVTRRGTYDPNAGSISSSIVEAEKTVLQKDRAEVARIASELKTTADRLAQTGIDVTTMRELLQRLEVKLATLDGVLDGMRDRRRKRPRS